MPTVILPSACLGYLLLIQERFPKEALQSIIQAAICATWDIRRARDANGSVELHHNEGRAVVRFRGDPRHWEALRILYTKEQTRLASLKPLEIDIAYNLFHYILPKIARSYKEETRPPFEKTLFACLATYAELSMQANRGNFVFTTTEVKKCIRRPLHVLAPVIDDMLRRPLRSKGALP